LPFIERRDSSGETGYSSPVDLAAALPTSSATSREQDVRNIERICTLYDAVMLFGSVARGDARDGSDVDVLAIAPRSRMVSATGHVSLTVYTEQHLRALARKGSLFVCHLRAEGKILKDRDGVFQRVFDEWHAPDIERAREGMNAARAVLDESQSERPDVTSRLRVGLYLLRSVLYLRCLELGEPVFAMGLVAARLGDERIAELYSRSARTSAEVRLALVMQLLEAYLPDGRRNPYGTLEALAVNWMTRYPMAADLAVRILTKDGRVDYAHSPVDWGDLG
jgi:predicted nucleotidyltransferase